MLRAFWIFLTLIFFSYTAFAQSSKQILEAEKLLSDLGYWVLKADGIKDDSTRHALVAFQKVEHRKRPAF